MLRNQPQTGGKDYSHEISILYTMVMQNKKDIEAIRESLQGGNGERLSVMGYRENEEPHPTITIAQPETPVRKHVDADDAEEVEASLRVEDSEKELIKRALEASAGNRKVAADKLWFSERTLYRKIKEYGL